MHTCPYLCIACLWYSVWLLPLAIHERVAKKTGVSLSCIIWKRNASLQLFEAVNYFCNKRKNNLLVNANVYLIFIFDSSIWNYVASEPIQFKFSERRNCVIDRTLRVLRKFIFLLFFPSSMHGAGKLACFDSTYLFSPCQRAPQLPGFWITLLNFYRYFHLSKQFIHVCLCSLIVFCTAVILNSLSMSSNWMLFSVIQLMFITFTVYVLCMIPALKFQHWVICSKFHLMTYVLRFSSAVVLYVCD